MASTGARSSFSWSRAMRSSISTFTNMSKTSSTPASSTCTSSAHLPRGAPLERRQQLLVAVARRERARIRREHFLGRRRVVFEQARHARENVHALGRILGPRELRLERADELAPIAARLVQRLENLHQAR